MSRRAGFGAIVLLILAMTALAGAQGAAPFVAFVNSSGQLVAASGDGLARWIVTNPGETLAQPLGFTWSPDGRRLFYAVNAGDAASLRVGDVASQSVSEIGQASGALSGGQWTPDGRSVLVAADTTLLAYPASGGSPAILADFGVLVSLISPYANDRPNVPAALSLSPDGGFIFLWLREGSQGRYTLLALNGGAVTSLPAVNDAAARQSGLWADSDPVVAYWGFDGGNSVLGVTHAASGQSVTLNSGRATPIAPAAWRPGTLQLVYRDTSDFVRIADLSCLAGGCGANPLESGVELMPATASDIQFDDGGNWVFYRDGEVVKAVNLGCLSAGNCAASAVALGDHMAQRTWVHAAGRALIYTAYAQDAGNPNDREVRVVNLDCLRDPASCRPATLLGQSVGGLASRDGDYVTVDQAGSGLSALRMADGLLTNLSGSSGGALGSALNLARWG